MGPRGRQGEFGLLGEPGEAGQPGFAGEPVSAHLLYVRDIQFSNNGYF